MILKKIYNHLSELALDNNEKDFLNFAKLKKEKFRDNVLLVVPNDYYYVCYNYLLSKEKLSKYNIYGYWPFSIHVKRQRLFENIHEIKSNIYFNLLKKKYFKLYQSVGLQKLWNLDKLKSLFISKSENDNMKNRADKLFKNIKNKKEVLNLHIDEIYCGDLIYDSYIRFRNKPTVDINDLFLKKLIYLSILSIKCFERLQNKYKFKYLFTTFATYIHYGLLVRVFLKKKVKIYSGATINQYNKKITNKDFVHVENFRKFQKIFSKLDNKKRKLKESKRMLDNIFFNKRKNLQFNDYMHVDPFKKNKIKLKKKFDGVVFLPNFFESQREWGKIIFSDFYEWITYTCNLINKYNLNIAIKPHPNTYHDNNETVNVVNELKLKYNNIEWIDPSISNHELFKNIKFGISVWGTVLWELAYFNVHPISAGEHPVCKYNIGSEPRTISQYKKILLSSKKLRVNKNISKKILEYCYMYYIYNNDAYKTSARKLNLIKMNFDKSSSLLKFMEKIKNYEKDI